MSPRNRVTVSDIAEQSGVSLPVVSLALRDKPGAVTKARLGQVGEVAGPCTLLVRGVARVPQGEPPIPIHRQTFAHDDHGGLS